MLYVVCENYTGAFCGLFIDEEDAKKRAERDGGYVRIYDLTEVVVMDKYGELVEKEEM